MKRPFRWTKRALAIRAALDHHAGDTDAVKQWVKNIVTKKAKAEGWRQSETVMSLTSWYEDIDDIAERTQHER